jgi:hypothetical protein
LLAGAALTRGKFVDGSTCRSTSSILSFPASRDATPRAAHRAP